MASSGKIFAQKSNPEVVVLVLGTAQDGGLPQLGCYCPNCQRARMDPRFARLISSLAVLDLKSQQLFFIDATPDIRAQLSLAHRRMEMSFSGRNNPPTGIVLTHAHIGHYTGLIHFGYEAMSAQKIPVYCTVNMAAYLKTNGPWDQLVKLENVKIQTFSEQQEIRLSPRIAFIPFLVPHRNEYTDTIGLIIKGPNKKLLYIPDIHNWQAWDTPIAEVTKKVEFALLDGTFFSPQDLPNRNLKEIGHPFILDSMGTLQTVIKTNKIRIYFTHLNHNNPALDPESKARQEIHDRGFHLAKEGMEFSL